MRKWQKDCKILEFSRMHVRALMLRSRFDANDHKLPYWEGLGVG